MTALRVLTVATVYAVAAGVTIFYFDGRLIPDTELYASSDPIARRSSPALSLIGMGFGYVGVQISAVIFAALLGAAMERYTNTLWAIALIALPWGWAVGLAGADSAGTLGALLAMVNPWLLPIAGVFHVQAALVSGLCFWFYRSGGSLRFVPHVAIAGAVFCCLYQWHLQTRYFMPAIAIAAWATVERRRLLRLEHVTG